MTTPNDAAKAFLLAQRRRDPGSAETVAAEFQARSGFTDGEMLAALLNYVDNQGSNDALADFLDEQLDEEPTAAALLARNMRNVADDLVRVTRDPEATDEVSDLLATLRQLLTEAGAL